MVTFEEDCRSPVLRLVNQNRQIRPGYAVIALATKVMFLASVAISAQAADSHKGELKALRHEMKVLREELRNLTEAYRRLEISVNRTTASGSEVKQLDAGIAASKATPPVTGGLLQTAPSAASQAASEAVVARSSVALPAHTPVHTDASEAVMIGHAGGPKLKLGANLDFLGAARNFGPAAARRQIAAREIELAIEAQVTDWLHGFVFLTRPNGEAFSVEEAAATATLPANVQIRAGFYRPEFGYLNTVHEPERLQISLPLPVAQFLGAEQLREGAVTAGKWLALGDGHRAGISAAVLNGDNTVALNGGISKAYTGKLYYGRQTDDYAYQFGVSALTGRNDSEGRLGTSVQAIDFRLFSDPGYKAGFDYPSRFSLVGEVLFSQKAGLTVDGITGARLRNTNRAVGAWTVADYQFMPAHHVGVGAEFTQGRENKYQKGTAYSAYYSWYFTPHSRMQAQLRRVNSDFQNRGWEAMLQWNVVLGPHSERPFLPILPFDAEK